MSTGETIGVFLAASLFVFAVWDIYLAVEKKETFSKWVVRNAKKRRSFAYGAFVVLTTLFVWLQLHFTIPCILFGLFCSLDV